MNFSSQFCGRRPSALNPICQLNEPKAHRFQFDAVETIYMYKNIIKCSFQYVYNILHRENGIVLLGCIWLGKLRIKKINPNVQMYMCVCAFTVFFMSQRFPVEWKTSGVAERESETANLHILTIAHTVEYTNSRDFLFAFQK